MSEQHARAPEYGDRWISDDRSASQGLKPCAVEEVAVALHDEDLDPAGGQFA